MWWKRVDPYLLLGIAVLVIAGFFIFSSASLGLLAREGASFSQVAFSQIVLGIVLGTVALIFFARFNYRYFKKFAPWIFIISAIITLLVFVPGIGINSGGASRWILLGPISFQPAEFLKLGFIIGLAFWLSNIRQRIHIFPHALVVISVLTAVAGVVLLLQPDTGTFLVLLAAGGAMFIAAGAHIRDLLILGLILIIIFIGVGISRPYITDRLLTFLNPASDPLGSGYQIQQSFIAIGSGKIFGRGFGQSVQKFNYLPQPINDSIFAVFAEEFGFVGGITFIGLLLFIAFRGFRIATRAPDYFGGLLALGIVVIITGQSFINIASVVGVLPLTGLPLLFVSQGGSAMLFALAEIGILLNISRYAVRSSL